MARVVSRVDRVLLDAVVVARHDADVGDDHARDERVKACDGWRSYTSPQPALAARRSTAGFGLIRSLACIVATHCCCCRVMVAEPSSSFLMREKLSTTTPTKRLIAKMYEKNIHAIGKSADSEKSFRSGATPARRAHHGEHRPSHSSAELIT